MDALRIGGSGWQLQSLSSPTDSSILANKPRFYENSAWGYPESSLYWYSTTDRNFQFHLRYWVMFQQHVGEKNSTLKTDKFQRIYVCERKIQAFKTTSKKKDSNTCVKNYVNRMLEDSSHGMWVVCWASPAVRSKSWSHGCRLGSRFIRRSKSIQVGIIVSPKPIVLYQWYGKSWLKHQNAKTGCISFVLFQYISIGCFFQEARYWRRSNKSVVSKKCFQSSSMSQPTWSIE